MTYEYVCTNCGHAWEAEQSISSPPLKTCPSCGADTAKRQVSGGAGFILKGGGWYADGYGSKKSEKSGSSDDKGSATKKANGDAAKGAPSATESAKSDVKSADAKSSEGSASSSAATKETAKKSSSADK